MASTPKTGLQRTSEDDRSPLEQLKVIDKKCRSLISYQDEVWQSLIKDIEDKNIEVLESSKLDEKDRLFLDDYFFSNVLLLSALTGPKNFINE